MAGKPQDQEVKLKGKTEPLIWAVAQAFERQHGERLEVRVAQDEEEAVRWRLRWYTFQRRLQASYDRVGKGGLGWDYQQAMLAQVRIGPRQGWVTLLSPSSLNDGIWHEAMASLGLAGDKLMEHLDPRELGRSRRQREDAIMDKIDTKKEQKLLDDMGITKVRVEKIETSEGAFEFEEPDDGLTAAERLNISMGLPKDYQPVTQQSAAGESATPPGDPAEDAVEAFLARSRPQSGAKGD